ncbi:hypothetical protein, partial [Escherichia coli]
RQDQQVLKQTNNISKYDNSGEVKSFSLEHFLKKWRRTKMGRHTWKVSPQTESQEQKQCAGAKDRELTGNSTAAE